jgi:PilZ domain
MKRKERRRYPRLNFETDIRVYSQLSGVLPGRGLDISESGMAAILPVELKLGETVDIRFRVAADAMSTRAIVRNKNVFRHGLQFIEPVHGFDSGEGFHLCKTCGGKGYVYRPLDRGKGVAFARITCADCGGIGK